jgi:flavin-dependent dehydrogenase
MPVPALIVGGGPAGAAAAITLAREGMAPLVIERTAEPRDVVCGGFLGWDALALLRRLGIDVAALGGRPIDRLRIVAAGRRIEAPLPHPAAGLSRRRLDAALLAAAERAGATVRRGSGVREADAGARKVRLADGETVACEALLLATGKHELRGLSRPLADRRARLAVGLRTALPPSGARTQALAGAIELHPFDGGYAGLLLQEDDCCNLCLSVSPTRLAASGGPAGLLAELGRELPALGERIAGDTGRALAAVAGVPYGWRSGGTVPGVFRIGDQAAVIASLAGDGIAVALASGAAAAEALLEGGPGIAPAWQRAFRQRSRRPLAVAETLRRGAEHAGSRAAMMALLGLAPSLTRAAALLTRIA